MRIAPSSTAEPTVRARTIHVGGVARIDRRSTAANRAELVLQPLPDARETIFTFPEFEEVGGGG